MQVDLDMCEPKPDQETNVLHVVGVIISSRESAEKLAKQIMAEAESLWPPVKEKVKWRPAPNGYAAKP